MDSVGAIAGIAALALVIVWNFLQSKRIDALQKRLDGMDKR
jgi:hypothetical protein